MREIKIKDASEIVYEHVCRNGLRVYIWPYNLSEEINLSLTVKYGSIHTEFKYKDTLYKVPNGTAHFLEHIKFKESEDSDANDFFYKLGSYTNAYTTYDHTSYEVICNNNIKDNLEHLLYFVLNPFFTEEIVEKEKGIIVEEAKSTLNNPYNTGYFTLMNNLYIKDKKKYLVTGMPEDVRKITVNDLKNVFKAFYHPKNMFLNVTGNINPYDIEKIVDEYFAKHKVGKYVKAESIIPKEPSAIVKSKAEVKTNVTKEKLFMCFKLARKTYKEIDDLHLRILFNIIMDINFGTTSEFNENLIINNIVDEIYYMVKLDKDNIIIIFESSSSYPNELSKKIREKFSRLSCPYDEFIRKNKVLIASSILGYEDANDVNNDIRADIIKYDKIINNIGDIFREITNDDAINVINLLKKYQVCEVILKPNND